LNAAPEVCHDGSQRSFRIRRGTTVGRRARAARPSHTVWEGLRGADRTSASRSDGCGDPASPARIARIRPADLARWRAGGPADWAHESFAIAASDAYGSLPAPGPRGRYSLSRRYVRQADEAVSLQLSRAGVRLAMLLNRALR